MTCGIAIGNSMSSRYAAASQCTVSCSLGSPVERAPNSSMTAGATYPVPAARGVYSMNTLSPSAPTVAGKLDCSRSSCKRGTTSVLTQSEIRARLADWVSTEVVPRLQDDLEQSNLPATVGAEGDKVFIEYTPLAAGTGYVAPAVMLEFGARSTGEPSEQRTVHCDAAAHLQDIEFPIAMAQVMRAERTFWEKATAIHVFCAQGEFRGGDRFARHSHDITRLDGAGFVDTALADKTLAGAVADHKSVFFAEKDTQGESIDYHAAVAGGLQLVPDDGALSKLRIDYQNMIDDGLLLDDAEPFEALLERCRAIEQKANAKREP